MAAPNSASPFNMMAWSRYAPQRRVRNLAAPGNKNPRAREMIIHNDTIEPGDRIRARSGAQAGKTGTAIDVIWYSDQNDMYALVHVVSDEGSSHFFDVRILEKVKDNPDNDLPSDGAKLTWKHVK